MSADFVPFPVAKSSVVTKDIVSECSPWFIVVNTFEHKITFQGKSQEETMAQFVSWKINQLTHASDEIVAHTSMLMQNDMLNKALAVQEGQEVKYLGCPKQGCAYMASGEIWGEHAEATQLLFAQVALHHVQQHRPLTSIHEEAQKLLATNFEEAFAKSWRYPWPIRATTTSMVIKIIMSTVKMSSRTASVLSR